MTIEPEFQAGVSVSVQQIILGANLPNLAIARNNCNVLVGVYTHVFTLISVVDGEKQHRAARIQWEDDVTMQEN